MMRPLSRCDCAAVKVTPLEELDQTVISPASPSARQIFRLSELTIRLQRTCALSLQRQVLWTVLPPFSVLEQAVFLARKHE